VKAEYREGKEYNIDTCPPCLEHDLHDAIEDRSCDETIAWALLYSRVLRALHCPMAEGVSENPAPVSAPAAEAMPGSREQVRVPDQYPDALIWSSAGHATEEDLTAGDD
jgi:hypothetical protein